MKKIFYLIPLYNSQQTISQCLNSIYSSKYNLEVVIINDGSNDKSEAVFNNIKNDLPYKTHFINNKQNLGISESLNKGLEIALSHNADYVLRLDSDDFNERGRTDYQVDYMESNPTKMICTSNAKILCGETIKNSWLLSLKSLFENQFRPFTNVIGSIDLHPTFCMRIDPFRKLGIRYGRLPENISSDSQFFIKDGIEDLLLINLFIFNYGFNCIHRDNKKKLINYRFNKKSLTPIDKFRREQSQKKIFLANQFLYGIKINQKNYQINSIILSKAISNYYFKGKFQRYFINILGILVLNFNYFNLFYKIIFFPILFFLTPRLAIQSITNFKRD